MSIMITGASGQLGHLAVEHLLARSVPASEIIASGRNVTKLAGLADRGVTTRRLDFADKAQLRSAFTDVERLLLVSSTTVGERFDNHRRVVDAARAANVAQLVYTSAVNADTARMRLADEHRKTEEYLRASGLPFTILRNGWYLENYTSQLRAVHQHGVLLGAAGDGLVSAASRSDLAEAAAIVLTGAGHEGNAYELGGDAFTLTELAETISGELGAPVTYRDLPVADFAEALKRAGLSPELADVLADADAGLARGELYTHKVDLARLLGRPPITRHDAVRAALLA